MTAQSNSSQYEPLEPYDTMTGTAIAISDADEAEALSEYLTSPDRQHPAVVVTRRFGKPLFDAKSLASNLHDVAAVFDLVTPKATWGGGAVGSPAGRCRHDAHAIRLDAGARRIYHRRRRPYRRVRRRRGVPVPHPAAGRGAASSRGPEGLQRQVGEHEAEDDAEAARELVQRRTPVLQVAAAAVRRQGGGQAVRARADGHAGPPRMGHAVRSGREEKPCAAEDMGVFRLVLRHAGIHTHQRQQGGGRDGRGADRA